MRLLKGGLVYAPESLGRKDILTGGGKILAIGDDLNPSGIDLDVVSAEGRIVAPALVDSHVHICGGGGEGGFSSRTPEIQISSFYRGGICAAVGVLGTDGTTRHTAGLLAKARGLTEDGVDCWIMTGSYQIPTPTLTGSVCDDIVLIDRIIGCGEICLSDHRSSHPSMEDLIHLVSEARRGGMLSGKCGLVNIHLGDGREGLSPLRKLVELSEIPLSQLQPTHVNRNGSLFEEGMAYAREGGYVDFTTSTTPRFIADGEVPAAEALSRCFENGVPLEHISFSSDGQGSLPLFDDLGNLAGMKVAEVSTLLDSFREAVRDWNIPVEKALHVVSTNPAERYKLSGKGRLRPGMDADLLLLDSEDLSLDSLYAGGRLVVQEGVPVVKGSFE